MPGKKIHIYKRFCMLSVLAAAVLAGTVSAAAPEQIIEVKTQVRTEKQAETENPRIPQRTIDFEELWETNEDIYSWVELPGTVIDYPVLQSGSDDEEQEYYLHMTPEGEESVYGSIFTQNYNRKDYTDFLTVIYGHNMRDYTMFGSLNWFREPDVMWKNKYVYIYLPEITLEYEIFAAYPIEAVHLLYNFDQEDKEVRRAYLKEIAEKGENVSTFDKELFETLTEDSHILVLHTCNGNPEQRFLVQAVLNEDAYDWDEKAVELGIREPEPETETETESESETKIKMASKSKAKAKNAAEAESESETETGTEVESGSEAETETEMESASETEIGTEVESGSEAETEAGSASETEIGTEAGNETQNL